MSPRGRPPIGPRLEVRVTPEQFEKLQRVAEAKGKPIAWVIRSLVDRLTE